MSELLALALEKIKDETILHWYTRLSFEDRHLLIDISKELKMDELNSILFMQ